MISRFLSCLSDFSYISSLQASSNKAYNVELKHYKSCHRNKFNIRIHYVTVPCEFLSYTIFISLIRLELVWITCIITILFLSFIESKVKYLACGLHTLIGMVAIASSCLFTHAFLFKLSLLLQFFSWCSQIIIGHYLMEGNSPSMTKHFTVYSIIVSLLLALDC